MMACLLVVSDGGEYETIVEEDILIIWLIQMGIFSSGIMIRIGKTEEIMAQYNEGYLKFGCPANWITYADSQPDGIADKYEAIFAHTSQNDPRLSMICDDGVPLNKYCSLWNINCENGTLYARYIFSCLVPTICFYSLNIKKILGCIQDCNFHQLKLLIDLRPYYHALNVDVEKSSLLVIKDPYLLVKELEKEIPRAVLNSTNVNTTSFESDNPYAIREVKYDLEINDMFFNLHPYDEIFRKRPIYKDQSEARLIIPNTNFYSYPETNGSSHLYNQISIPVPNIRNYSVIIPAIKTDRILIDEFNESLDEYTFSFLDSMSDRFRDFDECCCLQNNVFLYSPQNS